MKYRLLPLLVCLTFLQSVIAFSQDPADPIILTVGGEQIPRSEFIRVFKKNNTKESGFEKKAVDDYLELYINYKMKVHEALELGMDTVQSFKDELAGYRKQLAQPYLVDKQVSDALIKEAYNRMKTDIRASHILIKCDPNALPKDTLEAYNKALKVRVEVIKGSDFAAAARKYSDDPSAKENGGDLGYFTSMQMVYPFESAAYSLKSGDVSQPVRTRYGYHVIKVYDIRANQGEIRVSHIMVKIAAGVTGDDSVKAVQKINEIHAKLKAGDKFEDLAKQFSDDQSSAKNGGLLPWFGTGRMVPEFEVAAYALKYPGDFSGPVRTSYGWHIIKLMETKPLPSFESMQAELKQRVQKDSRSDLSKTSMIAKIKAKYGFKENVKARTDFSKVIDSTLSQGSWSADKAMGMNAVMFTLGNQNHTQSEFSTYLLDHQSRRGVPMPPVSMMNSLYSEWVDETCISMEESKLDSLYPDFRNLMQEYRDGILLFELMDEKVWSKAMKDTTGLKSFYEANKTKYMWPDRLDATIFTCANADVAKEVHKAMKKIDDLDTLQARINQSSQLNLQIRSSRFARGESEVIDQIEWKPGTTKDMPKNSQVVFVVVNKVMPSQPKSIDEAKGIITADYQSALEKEWIASLHAKYPVRVETVVVESVYSNK
ncbi:MAG: peptidylprolyl isomerase [Bacteroidota bacterium]